MESLGGRAAISHPTGKGLAGRVLGMSSGTCLDFIPAHVLGVRAHHLPAVPVMPSFGIILGGLPCQSVSCQALRQPRGWGWGSKPLLFPGLEAGSFTCLNNNVLRIDCHWSAPELGQGPSPWLLFTR